MTRIEISAYDPSWPGVFEQLRERLEEGLRRVEVLAIEHVGSTSGPTDFGFRISDFGFWIWSPGKAKAVALTKGDLGILGREAFKQPAGLPRHHLHLGVVGARPLVEHLAFRDFLRSDPQVVAEHGELKVRLAAEFAGDWDAYTEAKTSFIRGHLGRLALESGSGPQ
jgi:GrpB-like predicted nucleotidyltransferase (UPF0157 family)